MKLKLAQFPNDNLQVCFSGGRTSAMMLWQIKELGYLRRKNTAVVFTNTGREFPQTLDFIARCGSEWDVPIVWVEYDRGDFCLVSERPCDSDVVLWPSGIEGEICGPTYRIVSHNSAARDGEPFRKLVLAKQYLPNVVTRFCTIELKIRTAKRYLRDIGWDYWTNAIGFRADETHRVKPFNTKERWQNWHPLHKQNVSRRDVTEFWDSQSFDLELPNIDGRCPLGNCDGCFLKSEATLAGLARDYPDRYSFWMEMEKMTANKKYGSRAQFRKQQSYAALSGFVERQGDWIFDTDSSLCQADAGECTGF